MHIWCIFFISFLKFMAAILIQPTFTGLLYRSSFLLQYSDEVDPILCRNFRYHLCCLSIFHFFCFMFLQNFSFMEASWSDRILLLYLVWISLLHLWTWSIRWLSCLVVVPTFYVVEISILLLINFALSPLLMANCFTIYHPRQVPYACSPYHEVGIT